MHKTMCDSPKAENLPHGMVW